MIVKKCLQTFSKPFKDLSFICKRFSIWWLHFKYDTCETNFRVVTFVPLMSSECPRSITVRGSGGLHGFECWTTNISRQPTVKPPHHLCTLTVSPAQTRNKVENNPAAETFGSPSGAASPPVTNLMSSPIVHEQEPGILNENWILPPPRWLTVGPSQRFDGLPQETALPLPRDMPVFLYFCPVLWCAGMFCSFCTVGLFCTLLNAEGESEAWQQRRPACCCTWTPRPEDAVEGR